MRDAVARADLLAHHVAQPRRRGTRESEREPSRDLVLGADVEVFRVGLRARQRFEQAADGLERHHVVEWMLAVGEKTLDRVVKRANAGREPQLHWRLQR